MNIVYSPVKNIIFFGANLQIAPKRLSGWFVETHENGLNEKMNKDIIFFDTAKSIRQTLTIFLQWVVF
jgi:hypothetical protein